MYNQNMKRRIPATKNFLFSLEDLVKKLNNPRGRSWKAVHPKLVQLIRAWQQSTEIWRSSDRAWKVSGIVKASFPQPENIKIPEGCPTIQEMQENCQVLLGANPRGGQWHSMVVYSPKRRWTVWDHACFMFIPLVLNPECHRFRGPCPNCGRFFIRRTEREKRYCRRECAHKVAAQASTRRRRAREHEKRISEVEKAIEEWGRSRRSLHWITWVLKKVPDLSKTWITRAINRKQITAPI